MGKVETFLGVQRKVGDAGITYSWTAKDRRGRIIILGFKAVCFSLILYILIYFGVGADDKNRNGKFFLVIAGGVAIANLIIDIFSLSKGVFFILNVERNMVIVGSRSYDIRYIENVRVKQFTNGQFFLSYRIFLSFKDGGKTLVASRLSEDECKWLNEKLRADLNLAD